MSVLVVAMSLPNLELRAGTPFPSGGGEGQSPTLARGETPSREYSGTLLKGIIALIILVSSFFLFTNFITRINWKHLLWGVLGLLILIALLKLIPSTPIAQPNPEAIDSIDPGLVSTPTYAVSPLGEPPRVWRWIVLGILILAALFLLFWFVMRRTSPAQDMILQEAENAANAIQKGEDLKSVLLRCYQQMSRILREEQGIERRDNMTAREFMEILQEKGISLSPVRQLTLLFEAARYGAFPLGEREEQIGLDSLNEIIKDCQRSKE
jgi:hypothetical protein